MQNIVEQPVREAPEYRHSRDYRSAERFCNEIDIRSAYTRYITYVL